MKAVARNPPCPLKNKLIFSVAGIPSLMLQQKDSSIRQGREKQACAMELNLGALSPCSMLQQNEFECNKVK